MAHKIFKPETKSQKPDRKIQRVALLDVGKRMDCKPGYSENQYNLALGYLGAALLADGYEVMLLQQGIGKETEAQSIDAIRHFRPDTVAFSCLSYQYEATLRFKRMLLEVLPPDTITMVGGVHASISAMECSRDFHYVFVGEGENTLRELISILNDQGIGNAIRIPGLVFPPGWRERIRDLDRFGLPLRLDSEGVISPVPDDMTGFAPISFGRGCVRACTICTNARMYGSGPGARISRQPENVLHEIRLLYESGINYIWTHDEDMLADRDFLHRFCDGLLSMRSEKGIGNIYFGGMGSVRGLLRSQKPDHDLIKKLAEAGCIKIAFGIERASDQHMKELGKGITTIYTKGVLDATFAAGIAPIGLFMYGFEYETRESLTALVEFAKALPALRYRFAPVYPLKGTVFREQVDSNGIWLDERFKDDAYALCETPVLRNRLAQSVLDQGYFELLDFERRTLREIYGSNEYGERVARFVSLTGDRFRKFFKEIWKDYVRGELVGVEPKW